MARGGFCADATNTKFRKVLQHWGLGKFHIAAFTQSECYLFLTKHCQRRWVGPLGYNRNVCFQITNPGLPRANKAVSAEKPSGGRSPSDRSVLQQHVDFFDFDKDGWAAL